MTGTIANIIEISIKGEREKKKVEKGPGVRGQENLVWVNLCPEPVLSEAEGVRGETNPVRPMFHRRPTTDD
jgi:hypothetical protein